MQNSLFSIVEILIVLVPVLLAVAFITIIERKVIGSIQRRVGPNIVGVYGTLQPFADALKLVVKEQVIPTQSTKSLFFMAPIGALIFSILGWAIVPFSAGLALSDHKIGIIYSLALSSLGVYGVLFAGWSANSKYAFLGSLRSTAQIISYELIYSAAVLCILFIAGNFSITVLVEIQHNIWFIVPLLPIGLLFFIAALAETSRTPFDLTEAESELVAGFMTEHSGIIFVFFFLAEYCSIVLISTFTALLFIGGYLVPFIWILPTGSFISIMLGSLALGIKSVLFIFIFVWIRATLPRVRYDQLIVICWTQFLPVAFAAVIFVPCIIVAFDIIATH